MGHLPLFVYFDFKMTTGSDLFLDKENVCDQLQLDVCLSPKTKKG